MSDSPYDVIVVGAGNAALCAAIAARETGARVLVLEKAAEPRRAATAISPPAASASCTTASTTCARTCSSTWRDAEAGKIVFPGHDRQYFYETLMEVTRRPVRRDAGRILIDNSRPTIAWMRKNGVRFIPMFGRQSFEVDGKHHFYGGVTIEAVGGGCGPGRVPAQALRRGRHRDPLRHRRCASCCRTATAASPASPSAARPATRTSPPRRWCSPAAASSPTPRCACAISARAGTSRRVRGTRHNTGDGITHGARDRRRAVRRLVGLPRGAVGHLRAALRRPLGARQLPEALLSRSASSSTSTASASSTRAPTTATTPTPSSARQVMKQPQRGRCRSSTSKTVASLRDEYRIKQVTKVEADTIEGLAQKLEIDPEALAATVADVQRRLQARRPTIRPSSTASPRPASRRPSPTGRCRSTSRPTWPSSSPRHHLHLRRPQDRRARAACRTLSDRSIPGLFAAGELVGGLFYENYPGGTGLMSGSVFGKRAGTYAAEYARGLNAPAQS